MSFPPKTIPWRLVDNTRSLCSWYQCSAVSFYFEYVGEGNYVVHRTYFDPMQIIFITEGRESGKLKIHDTQRVVSFLELRAVIDGFLHGRTDETGEVIKESILSNCADYLSGQFEELEPNSRKHLSFAEGLNKAFFGYAYFPADHAFKEDASAHLFNDYEDAISEGRALVRPVVEETITETPHLYELRVYSVGQANCSALIRYVDETKQDYSVVVVFDFGCANRKRGNPDLREMISKIDRDTTIVISHFDNDHFNNITELDLSKTMRWVFPNCLNYNAVRANKMFQALMAIARKKTSNGSIMVLRTPHALSEHIRLYQNQDPNHMDSFQSTPSNACSLVATIKSGTLSILLPADALYEEFPNEVLEDTFDWVLVPHHGCKYRGRSYSSGAINRLLGRRHVKGVVQCGKNKYGHANVNHLSWYSNVSYFYGAVFYDDDKVPADRPPSNASRVYDKCFKISL